jgi:hypothetical protein
MRPLKDKALGYIPCVRCRTHEAAIDDLLAAHSTRWQLRPTIFFRDGLHHLIHRVRCDIAFAMSAIIDDFEYFA